MCIAINQLGSVSPYYSDEFASVYNVDSSILMDLCLPPCVRKSCTFVFVTDPPYGINGSKNVIALSAGSRKSLKGNYDDSDFHDSPDYISGVCVPIVTALSASCRAGAVTPGSRNLMLYPQPVDLGCFWTPAASGQGPWGFTTFHPILYYGYDHRSGRGTLPSGRVVTGSAERVDHPCPKPLSAWSWLVDKVSKTGDIVIDPFSGSGTTAVAAKRCGIRSVSFEISERYCEVSAKRLEQNTLFGA